MYDRRTAIQAITAAFPESAGMKSPGCVRATLLALCGWGEEFEQAGEEVAAAWLLSRVIAYAGSPKLKGVAIQYRPSMSKWFQEEMYNCDDKDWGIRTPAPAVVKVTPIIGHEDGFRKAAAENWKRRHGSGAKEGECA